MYGHDKARTAPFTASDWTNLSVASDFTREHFLVSIGAAPVKRADGTGQVAYRLQLATRTSSPGDATALSVESGLSVDEVEHLLGQSLAYQP